MRAEKTTERPMRSSRQRWPQKGKAEGCSHRGLLTERSAGHGSRLGQLEEPGRPAGLWTELSRRIAGAAGFAEPVAHPRKAAHILSWKILIETTHGFHSFTAVAVRLAEAEPPGTRGSRGQGLTFTDFVGGSGEGSASESL